MTPDAFAGGPDAGAAIQGATIQGLAGAGVTAAGGAAPPPWPATVKWTRGAPPTLTRTPIDIVTFKWDSVANTYSAVLSGDPRREDKRSLGDWLAHAMAPEHLGDRLVLRAARALDRVSGAFDRAARWIRHRRREAHAGCGPTATGATGAWGATGPRPRSPNAPPRPFPSREAVLASGFGHYENPPRHFPCGWFATGIGQEHYFDQLGQWWLERELTAQEPAPPSSPGDAS